MPAQRNNKRRKLLQREKKVNFRFIFYLILLLLIIIIFLYLRSTLGYWSDNSKVSVVYPRVNGDVELATFDPIAEEITRIVIPGDTQVEVANNMGVWRIKSVWELSKNENLGGALLARTVTKHFNFPVYIWSNLVFNEMFSGSLRGKVLLLASSEETNLGLGDKIRIVLFNLKIPNQNRLEYDLRKTNLLDRKTLSDGEEGYVFTDRKNSKIMSVFAEPEISRLQLKVSITNLSGKRELSKEVGEIIEVLGAKATSMNEGEQKKIDCVVKGADKYSVDLFSKYLGCDLELKGDDDSFNVEIVIGTEFAQKY